MQVELAQNVLHVHLDGAFGHVHFARDLLVADTLRQPGQGFALTRGERFVFGRLAAGGGRTQALYQLGGHLGREHVVAIHGATDGGEQEVGIDLFQQIAAGSGFHALGQVFAVFRHRQHQHRQLRLGVEQLCQGIAAMHHRHVQIQQDHIGVQLLGQLDPFQAIAGFAHDLEIGLALQQRLEAAAEQGVIIYQQDADRAGSGIVSHVALRSFSGRCRVTRVPPCGTCSMRMLAWMRRARSCMMDMPTWRA